MSSPEESQEWRSGEKDIADLYQYCIDKQKW